MGPLTMRRQNTGRGRCIAHAGRPALVRGTREGAGFRALFQPFWMGLLSSTRLFSPALAPLPGALFTERLDQRVKDALRRGGGFLQRAFAQRLHAVAAFGTAAALRRWVRQPG